MKPYSQNLRERIVRALQEQEATQDEIASRFSVSSSFVAKLWVFKHGSFDGELGYFPNRLPALSKAKIAPRLAKS